MALNGTTAGDAVFAAISGLSSADKNNPQKVWEAIMTAIYADIAANAVASGTCPAGGGPLTGGRVT